MALAHYHWMNDLDSLRIPGSPALWAGLPGMRSDQGEVAGATRLDAILPDGSWKREWR